MNIIEIPSDHEMFSREISGEINNFIYDEFGLIFQRGEKTDIGVIVLFKNGISGTEIALSILNDTPINDDVLYELQFSEDSPDGLEITCTSNNPRYLNIGHQLAYLVLKVMLYIMTAQREKVFKQKSANKEREKHEKNKKEKSEDKIYLLDEIVDYVNENGLMIQSSGTHKINCPCWSVRGHYRHYKTGKVIFVENYKKGKDRDKIEPKSKTYTV